MKSDATRKKMSDSAKARCSEEWRRNQSEKKRTTIPNEDLFIKLHKDGYTHQQLASRFSIGRKVVANAIKRLGLTPHKAAKRNQNGPSNANWRGEAANIVSKHKRLYRAFGQPSKCDVCGTEDPFKSYDWANLTGNYDDPKDFRRMCRSCHWKYDKKHLNFKRACGNT